MIRARFFYNCVVVAEAGEGTRFSESDLPFTVKHLPLAWYLYHYLLTFSLEFSVIWRSKPSGTTILFLINRYSFFFQIVLDWAVGLIVTDNIKVSFSMAIS